MTALTTVVVTQQTVTSSSQVAPPAPPRPSETAPVAAADEWAAGPNRAGVAPSPQFPESLPDWRLNNSWDLTERAFDSTWTDISGPDYGRFPSTMNGCDSQRFLVRWRAVDDSAQLDAVWLDAADGVGAQVTAHEGWFDLDGCEHPAFRLASNDNGSTLTDVPVSVHQYWPAA